ncbi:MAG: thermonuclease family protein [Proteobacteria bacterium]|nr:thermonuclease family protein [Pseudomonadota bacterium]
MASLPALADVIEGRVIEVPDGGSVTILARGGTSLHRVRLAGILAPRPDSPSGVASRESLRRIVRGKTVQVDTSVLDTRGVLVGEVQVLRDPKDCRSQPCQERIDPALTQLAAGLASLDLAYDSRQPEETLQRYQTAQSQAKARKLGLWRPAYQPVRADFRYGEVGILR